MKKEEIKKYRKRRQERGKRKGKEDKQMKR